MVIHESFVTRKPMEFTLIVLFVILLLLIPVYLYTRNSSGKSDEQPEIITESYPEVAFLFSTESDLSDSDKKHLFKLKYEGSVVQWDGNMLSCDPLDGMYRVRVDETGDEVGDVLFTTEQDCTSIPPGAYISFRTKLIDWKVTRFIGSKGEVTGWV